MNKRPKLPITPGSKFANLQGEQEQTGQQGPIRRIPASHQTQSASHAQLKPKNSKKNNVDTSRNSSTSRRLKGPKSDRSNISEHSASQNAVLRATKNASRGRDKSNTEMPISLNKKEDGRYLDQRAGTSQSNQRKLLQQGHSSGENSDDDHKSVDSDGGRQNRNARWADRGTAKSSRELPVKHGQVNQEVPIDTAKRRNTQHQQNEIQANGYLRVDPRRQDNNSPDPDDLSYNQEESNQHNSNVVLTGSNDESAQNLYGSNQKIEYVNKQYTGYGWCCSSGEMTEIVPTHTSSVKQTEETQPTVAARMLGFFGWQTTEQTNTQANEEVADLESTRAKTSKQSLQTRTISNTTYPSSNSFPPTEMMPHKMRQQLGLTPKTNMRLFQTDNQPLKKSMLSNTSIAPCSEESFVQAVTDHPRQQKPNDFRQHQQPPKALKNHQKNKYNASTNSYDYHSSLGGESNPPSNSIVDNLHAISIDIKRREKELELQASNSTSEPKKLRTIGDRRGTENTISAASQIPEEGESGGHQAKTHQKPLEARRNTVLSSQSQKEENLSSQHSQKQTKQVSINFESMIMLENKLNKITNGLQKIRHVEAKAMMTYKYERQSIQANENFRVQLDELIGLCEEYWSILRSQSFLFCQLPQRMFKDNPRLVHEIKRTFVLKLVVVSEIGFLISNEDFSFADTHLKDAMILICKGFLTFMRVILSKLTTTMLQTFFWARKLETIVTQKMKVDQADDNFRMNIRCNSPNPSALSGQSAVDKLRRVNSQTMTVIQTMFEDVDRLKMNPVEGYDVEKFDHKLFATITNILTNMGTLNFREVSTLIGQSLVSEFAELDDSENARNDGRKLEGTFPITENKAPFLPKPKGNKKYTLVLDLDETLVHYNEEQNCVLIRPFAVKFLQQMAMHYEVVIFTAGTKDYADWALEHLPNKAAKHYIDHRLYRDHTIQCMEVFIKDLSYLGRDLDRTIIVDNITENFLLQPDNGITIKSWFDDPDDTALMDMAPLLRQIVEQSVPDVRIALKESKEQLFEAMASGEINPMQRLRQVSISDRSDQQLSSKKEVTGPKATQPQQLSERM